MKTFLLAVDLAGTFVFALRGALSRPTRGAAHGQGRCGAGCSPWRAPCRIAQASSPVMTRV